MEPQEQTELIFEPRSGTHGADEAAPRPSPTLAEGAPRGPLAFLFARWDWKLNGYVLTSGLLLLLYAVGAFGSSSWILSGLLALIGAGFIARNGVAMVLGLGVFVLVTAMGLLAGMMEIGLRHRLSWECVILVASGVFGSTTYAVQRKVARQKLTGKELFWTLLPIVAPITLAGFHLLLPALLPQIVLGLAVLIPLTYVTEKWWGWQRRKTPAAVRVLGRATSCFGWGFAAVTGAALLAATVTFFIALPDRLAIGRILADAHRRPAPDAPASTTDGACVDPFPTCPRLPTSTLSPAWSLGLQADFTSNDRSAATIESGDRRFCFKKVDGTWRYDSWEYTYEGNYRGPGDGLPSFYWAWASSSWW
jgi:hypothetical protein